MLAQVGEPLLQVIRVRPDFWPAYLPLLGMAESVHAADPAGARALLTRLNAAAPTRPEARRLLRELVLACSAGCRAFPRMNERTHAHMQLAPIYRRWTTVRSARKDRTGQPTSPTRPFRPGILIRIRDVCDFVDTSRRTIYRWAAEEAFPAPVRISEKAIRWKVDDIEAWRGAL